MTMWCSVLLVLTYSKVITSSDESTLIRDLLKGYHVNNRPVDNPREPVNVDVDLVLHQIITLDERELVMTGNYWIRLTWEDSWLKWDPSEYGNVTTLHIVTKHIWVPDITLYNDISVYRFNTDNSFPAIIDYNGTVNWGYPRIYQSHCAMNVSLFPYDSQSCELVFGSWSHSTHLLDITNKNEHGDMEQFINNGEWVFTSFPVKKCVLGYKETNESYTTLKYQVNIDRKPLYYMVHLITPFLFINFCGILVFLLPPDCGEKVTLSVTVLLSSTFFLLLLRGIVPVQSDVFPLIGRFFLAQLLLLVLNTVVTVFVVNIHFKGDFGTPVPRWLYILMFKFLFKFMFMKKLAKDILGLDNMDEDNELSNLLEPQVEETTTTPSPLPPDAEEDGETQTKTQHFNPFKKFQMSHRDKEDEKVQLTNVSNSNNLKDSLRDKIMKLAGTTDDDKANIEKIRERITKLAAQRQWEVIAIMLDRLFLVLFIVITLSVIMYILLSHNYANRYRTKEIRCV